MITSSTWRVKGSCPLCPPASIYSRYAPDDIGKLSNKTFLATSHCARSDLQRGTLILTEV